MSNLNRQSKRIIQIKMTSKWGCTISSWLFFELDVVGEAEIRKRLIHFKVKSKMKLPIKTLQDNQQKRYNKKLMDN